MKEGPLRFNPRKMRVLVVEDSEFDRELIVANLKAIGFKTIWVAENGSIGAAKIESAMQMGKPIDVIFLDANLPAQNGMGLLRWIREDSRFSEQIVIMTTAQSSEEVVTEAIELAVNGYVVKPVTLEVLRDKIDQALMAAKKRAG